MSISFDQFMYLKQEMRKTILALPRKVGAEVVNFSLDNFKRQGFLGNAVQPWQPRKVVTRRNAGRDILVQSGRGRRSIRIMSASTDTVIVGSNLPYMKAHNEGFRGTVTVKAHERLKFTKERIGSGKFTNGGKERMKTVNKISGKSSVQSFQRKMILPKRQFLGESPYLTARIQRLITADIMKVAKSI
jgi:phage gpG-like protein